MSGVDLIAQERARQIAEEGWTSDHDDRYTGDELVRAAICYTFPPAFRDESPVKEGIDGWEPCSTRDAQYFSPELWPFPPSEWNPTPNSRLRELAKAGSLIAAEMDRLLRKGPG